VCSIDTDLSLQMAVTQTEAKRSTNFSEFEAVHQRNWGGRAPPDTGPYPERAIFFLKPEDKLKKEGRHSLIFFFLVDDVIFFSYFFGVLNR